MSQGPEFTQKTKDVLAKRAAQICSDPDCRRSTSGPHTESNKAINLGEAAHIKAAREGQARYDPNMTDEERKSISNGIWLCRECARKIDLDEIKHTVELLRRWKKEHEDHIAAGKSSAKSISPAKERLQNLAYNRLGFLDSIDQNSDPDELERHVSELLEFVSALNAGALFAKRIEKLTQRRRGWLISFGDESPEVTRARVHNSAERAAEYRTQLQTACSDIYSIIDELLGLQP